MQAESPDRSEPREEREGKVMPISADKRSEYVYVFIDQTGRFAKIGRSKVPARRLQYINVSTRRLGLDMKFLTAYFGGSELEKRLHEDLADLSFDLNGYVGGFSEFFRVDLRLLARLAEIPNPIHPPDICTHGVWTAIQNCDYRFCPKHDRHYLYPDIEEYIEYAEDFDDDGWY